jgi:hypothetical protein
MLMRILTGIVTCGALARFVLWLARRSMRHEMSKHASPFLAGGAPLSHNGVSPGGYGLRAHGLGRDRCAPCPVMCMNGQEQSKRSVRDG